MEILIQAKIKLKLSHSFSQSLTNAHKTTPKMQEEKDIYDKGGYLAAVGTILETQRKEEGRKRMTIFIYGITHRFHTALKLFKDGSSYHRNRGTQSHRPLLQSRMSHSAQPGTQPNFYASETTPTPYTTKEQASHIT